MSFSELRQKDVINIADGRRLGKPIDVTFTENACIQALIVPEAFSLMGCLKSNKNGTAIPWERVRRIGDDVILVELSPDACG